MEQIRIPVALGHAASVALAAALILALRAFVSIQTLQIATAVLLVAFGGYKLLNWYRHPRWVGMRVRWHELTGWSFLMATAHGAGLMVAPALLGVMSSSQTAESSHHITGMSHTVDMVHTSGITNLAGIDTASAISAGLAVGLHTFTMLLTMAVIAWIVYRKLGLMVRVRTQYLHFR